MEKGRKQSLGGWRNSTETWSGVTGHPFLGAAKTVLGSISIVLTKQKDGKEWDPPHLGVNKYKTSKQATQMWPLCNMEDEDREPFTNLMGHLSYQRVAEGLDMFETPALLFVDFQYPVARRSWCEWSAGELWVRKAAATQSSAKAAGPFFPWVFLFQRGPFFSYLLSQPEEEGRRG